MGRPSSYPKELRDRAVRMVLETKGEYPTEFNAIVSISEKLGDRFARDVAEEGSPDRDRLGSAARDYDRRVGTDQGAQAGER